MGGRGDGQAVVMRHGFRLIFLGFLGACGWAAAAAADAPDFGELMREGAPLFVKNCAPCHGRDGHGGYGGPNLATSALARSPSGLIAQIYQGDTNQVMPAFGAILGEREILAIASYVRNAFGNAYGPLPAEFFAKAGAPR